jgi:hypothetical protein
MMTSIALSGVYSLTYQSCFHRLALATQTIEAGQVAALKSIVSRRDAAASEARFLTDTALKGTFSG